jgi:integrase
VPKTEIVVPTVAEVRALIDCATTPFARVMFQTAYGCGLRVSEVCALRVEDIDSKYKLIHVRHGKGDKKRTVMMGERLLAVLRDHWLLTTSRPWARPPGRPGRINPSIGSGSAASSRQRARARRSVARSRFTGCDTPSLPTCSRSARIPPCSAC